MISIQRVDAGRGLAVAHQDPRLRIVFAGRDERDRRRPSAEPPRRDRDPRCGLGRDRGQHEIVATESAPEAHSGERAVEPTLDPWLDPAQEPLGGAAVARFDATGWFRRQIENDRLPHERRPLLPGDAVRAPRPFVLHADVEIPAIYPDVAELGYLGGHTLGELLRVEKDATEAALTERGRMNMTITLPEVSAHTLGELLMMLQIATAYAGALYQVNPYDQPGVELGKELTYGFFGRVGYQRPDAVSRDPRRIVQ